MKEVDCIIVSNARTQHGYELTANTLASLSECEAGNTEIEIHVTVIEQSHILWPGCQTIRYNRDFNYNACLNLAMRNTCSEYVWWLNNDLKILPGALSELVRCAHYTMFESFGSVDPLKEVKSPLSKYHYLIPGYDIGKHVTGWAIFTSRDVWQRIGGLCEHVTFWYSDDAYVVQLQRAGIGHALSLNSKVIHLESGLLNKLPKAKYIELTHGQRKLFEQWQSQTS